MNLSTYVAPVSLWLSTLNIHLPPFPCPAEQYIEEITEGADKQLKIEVGLAEIMEKWAAEAFVFNEWKGRGINVLKSTGTIVEELEEAQVTYLSVSVSSNILSRKLLQFLKIFVIVFLPLSPCRFGITHEHGTCTNRCRFGDEEFVREK